MSHFLGAVIVPPGIDATLDTVGREPQDYLASGELWAYLKDATRPFCDWLAVDRYRVATRDELIAAERACIDHFARHARLAADGGADTSKYPWTLPSHIYYGYLKNAPKMQKWTDRQVWAYTVRDRNPDDIDRDGSLWSTANPRGFWDAWVIGGGWTDIAELQGEPATELAKRMIAPHRHQDGEDVFDDPSTLIFPTGDQFDALSLVNDDFLLPADTRSTRERCTEAIRVLQSAGPAAKIIYLDFHG